MDLASPRYEQHRSFQHKVIHVFRSGQTVQKALNDPSANEKLEIIAASFRQGEELRTV